MAFVGYFPAPLCLLYRGDYGDYVRLVDACLRTGLTS